MNVKKNEATPTEATTFNTVTSRGTRLSRDFHFRLSVLSCTGPFSKIHVYSSSKPPFDAEGMKVTWRLMQLHGDVCVCLYWTNADCMPQFNMSTPLRHSILTASRPVLIPLKPIARQGNNKCCLLTYEGMTRREMEHRPSALRTDLDLCAVNIKIVYMKQHRDTVTSADAMSAVLRK